MFVVNLGSKGKEDFRRPLALSSALPSPFQLESCPHFGATACSRCQFFGDRLRLLSSGVEVCGFHSNSHLSSQVCTFSVLVTGVLPTSYRFVQCISGFADLVIHILYCTTFGKVILSRHSIYCCLIRVKLYYSFSYNIKLRFRLALFIFCSPTLLSLFCFFVLTRLRTKYSIDL